MKETAMRCATNAITSQHDALVVIIMSHGKKDEVLGIDGVGVTILVGCCYDNRLDETVSSPSSAYSPKCNYDNNIVK